MAVSLQSALMGALVTVAVMTSLLLQRRRRRSDRWFAILCSVLVAWFWFGFLFELTQQSVWRQLELALGAALPLPLLRLFEELMPGTRLRTRLVRRLVVPVSIGLAVLALSQVGLTRPAQTAVGAGAVVAVLAASRALIRASEGENPVERTRRVYLAIGASIVASVCWLCELPSSADLQAVGHTAAMVYVTFLSQVILRERLMDLNEFLGRMAVLAVLAVVFATIGGLLISISDNLYGRLFNAVVAVVIVLTLYEPLKQWVEQKTSEVFFRERHRFTQAVAELRRRLQRGVLDPMIMADIVTEALYASRRTTHTAVYLLDADERGFRLAAHRGPEPALVVNPVELPDLYKAVNQSTGPLLAELLIETDDGSALVPSMRAASGDAVFPFASDDAGLGFLAVRDDRSVEAYGSAELHEIQRLAETCTTIIWNSKLAESVRERERLAAIGAMAAGLAHEIRNPLGAIKGAAEYLDPARSGARGEFLRVIIEETDRLNAVVSQFLDYARPAGSNRQWIRLNDIVRSSVRLVEVDRRLRIDLRLAEDLPSVQADPEQLKQVILNLLLNAVDASPDHQPIMVRTQALGPTDQVELRVEDRGVGIPTQDLERIFIPFFTTKHTGTGLGLAVCQRIVQAHGGLITAASSPEQGTAFVVRLPRSPEEPKAEGAQVA
jgi:signal transduction histidine kinase